MIHRAYLIEKFEDLNESEYSYFKQDGIWYLYLPGCGLSNLAGHEITEHRDGTITAHPSILTTGHDSGEPVQRHGYLEKGIWRDC